MFQEKNDKKLYIVMVTATILIGAVFFILLLRRPVNNYSIDVTKANPDIGRMEEDGYYFDTVHGEELVEEKQKVFLNIAEEVKAGSYTVRIGYRSNAGSVLSLTSKSNPWAVKCDEISLNHMPKELPGEFNMNYGLGYLPGFSNSQMYITRDVKDLDVYVVYCGFQDFYIQSIELIGNRNYVKTIWLVGMFLLVFIELIVIGILKEFWKTEKGIAIEIIVGISLLTCIPLLFRMGLRFDDGYFLYGKIDGIMDGIRDGQFPVRIHPNTLKGYGYAVSYFYPELFLYPFALLRGIGYSLRFCVYLSFFCVNLLTVAICFVCVKRIIETQNNESILRTMFIPSVCSFLYAFNIYRLLDLYSRGAIGEALALAFLPLVITGLYIVIAEDGKITWLVLGLFGLINSHVLTTELVAEFAILLCIVCFKKIFRKECFLKLAAACIITALLSAYYIIPFLHMSTTDAYKVYAENAYNTSETMLSLKDIFALTISTVGKVNNGTFFNARYNIGLPNLIFAIALFIVTSIKRKRTSFETICFSFGVIALWITSSFFPWKWIESVGGVIRTVFCMVQFPCRYLAIAGVCFIFSIAKGLEALNDVNDKDKSKAIGIASTAICVLLVTQSSMYFSTLKQVAGDEYLIYDSIALGKFNMVGMGEYEPVNFEDGDLDHSIEELQLLYDENAKINPTGDDSSSGLTIGPLSKSGTKSTILVINPTGEEKILYMPITYYKGYKVENIAKSEDGADIVPELFETEHGTVGLKIPVGYYNGVHITYHESILYRMCSFISVLTLAGIAVFKTKRKMVKANE